MTQIIALVDMSTKKVLYYILHMFKNVEEILIILSWNMKDTKKFNTELLETKTTMSGMKNMLEEISSKLYTKDGDIWKIGNGNYLK